MKNVLLIAGLSEAYYNMPFVEACEGKELALYLLDMSRFPELATFSVALKQHNTHLEGFLDVLKLSRNNPVEYRLPIEKVDVAWYLREAAPYKSEPLSLETRFAENEMRAAFHSLLSALSCRWVNSRETLTKLASNKLYQQLIANRVTLLTPSTLLSNAAESVNGFSAGNGGLLLKAIGYMQLDQEGKNFLYSERFEHGEIVDNGQAIKFCPVFSQEYVEKKYEYRVMVIGKKVLACRIDSQASEQTKVDWRHYDFENVSHVQAELPDAVQVKLIAFMREAQLSYGAIDLIETPEGEFVFLEVNPSGQWGWIADLAELPIPDAVASMLLEI